MPQSWIYEHTIGTLDLSVRYLGKHLVISIGGSDVPHIGSVVLAEPRPSLRGAGLSATSSVLNRAGHKDEAIARPVAETLAARLDTVVCCVCGIHKNDASTEDITACVNLGDELAAFLFEKLNEVPDNHTD